MVITKKRLRLAIDRYEDEIIIPQISKIKIAFIWQIVYIAVLIIFGILTNLKPSWNSVVGTLGLGGLSLKANGKTAIEAWKRFMRDRRILMRSVIELRVRLDLCYEDEESCLKDVESRIREHLETMRG